MKEKRRTHLSLRIRFTLLVIIEMVVIALISEIVTSLLGKYFDISIQIPGAVWAVLISVVLGSAVTTFLGKKIFDPIQKLGEAMSRVADGNFKSGWTINADLGKSRKSIIILI